MEQETLKQAGRFYRCIIFQLLWLVIIIALAVIGFSQTNQIAKSFLKYFVIAYAIFLFFILIYFPFFKKIGINKLMNYMVETTKPLPFFSKRTVEENMKLGRIFSYCCLAIFAIINYFTNIVTLNMFIFLVIGVIILDILFYVLGFYKFLKNKIVK